MRRNEIFVPEHVMNEALEAVGKVVPVKCKILYEKEYNCLCNWRNKKNDPPVDVKIILAYISERSKTENVDINRFHQVETFLKQHSVGHRAKK
ncbi:hypothetical protein MTP99_011319 [Tenebrio molitor]|nr:hypothetical protein MTP99_011319 [Tenebrio molitor]